MLSQQLVTLYRHQHVLLKRLLLQLALLHTQEHGLSRANSCTAHTWAAHVQLAVLASDMHMSSRNTSAPGCSNQGPGSAVKPRPAAWRLCMHQRANGACQVRSDQESCLATRR